MTPIIAPRPKLETRAAAKPPARRPQRPENLSFALVSAESEERHAVEQSITRKFERVYGAHLNQFLPRHLRLGVADELGAVAGMRPAGDSELFLEQYLGQPIEQAIARAFSAPVDRAQIVEIGNLAASAWRWCIRATHPAATTTLSTGSMRRIASCRTTRASKNGIDWRSP
jgi:hypothetical protein